MSKRNQEPQDAAASGRDKSRPSIGPDPIAADVLASQSARRLPTSATCVECGEADPTVLRGRSIIEKHHVAGRTNDEKLVAALCLNCHRKNTNAQRSVGVPLDDDPDRSMPERLIALLRGLAVLLSEVADSLFEWAYRMEALVLALDAADANWRQLPEASC